MHRGKGSLYAKAMIGRGDFIHDRPGHYSSTSYSFYAFGAGLDYLVRPNWKIRLVDAEFQTWPQFKALGRTPYAISTGFMYSFTDRPWRLAFPIFEETDLSDGPIWRSRLMKTSVFGFLLLFSFSGSLRGQATPTASKTFDLQVGGGYVLDNGDYGTKDYRGGGVYATLDFKPHFGAEIDFHQANYPSNAMYERTYEVGGRYHRTYGRLSPYVKAMYGRGVFNFVYGGPDIVVNGVVVEHSGAVVANLAFNEFVFGGGADVAVLPWLNVRGDYEYQSWHSFPPNGLTPQLITIGVAYHFPGGLERGRHFR